jgi:uncharacterized protein YkwD
VLAALCACAALLLSTALPAAASAQACAGANAQPTRSNLSLVRRATLCLINQQRSAHGLRRLSSEPHLRTAAQRHSDAMGARHFFDHVSPSGAGPAQRLRAAGYRGGTWGENIAWGTGLTPAAAVDMWMNSPGHRANILRAQFRRIGIGVGQQAPDPAFAGRLSGVYTTDFGGS